MKSFIRYEKQIPRRVAENRYPLIRAKIGYLYRADGKILSDVCVLTDERCRDGAMLRVPAESFTEVYYAKFLPQLKNDMDQESAAVYFDPYGGKFLVVGSKQLFLDARAVIGFGGAPLYLEEENPFRFDPMTWGTYEDVSEQGLTFEEYFMKDVRGVTVAECMVRPVWDDLPHPWRCAMDFFDRYCDKLFEDVQKPGADTLTTLLAAMVREENHSLLARLFTLIPQTLARFRPILREEQKFAEAGITVPAPDASHPAPQIFNLFQYTMLCGDPDVMQTVFRFYERPMELCEMLHHPTLYHLGFYHIRSGNHAALALLLENRYNPDCTDAQEGRMTPASLACLYHRPAMISMLVKYGCDVEKKDNHAKCALDYAAEVSDAVCLKALFSAKSQHLKESADLLAASLPLDDDNQALLCVLRDFMRE